jgi:DtxR family Mn-dependent transcriptional regulator
VTDALEKYLGYPATCPHGNPIPVASVPGADRMPVAHCPLSELGPGHSAVVVRVHPESAELLGYLSELGLLPGTPVKLLEVEPFQGPLVLSVNQDVRYIGREAAAHVYVHVIEETS